ncbi:hypothetical protein [Pseudomonas sp. SDO5591_S426]
MALNLNGECLLCAAMLIVSSAETDAISIAVEKWPLAVDLQGAESGQSKQWMRPVCTVSDTPSNSAWGFLSTHHPFLNTLGGDFKHDHD